MVNRRSRRGGITLVELLVVIAIIGMLVGLLLPALNVSHGAGGRTQCLNNQKNVATALLNFASAKNHLPGYKDTMTFTTPVTINGTNYTEWPVSWVTMILQELGRNDLWNAWKIGGPTSFLVVGPGALDHPIVRMPVLKCPSNPPDNSVGQSLAFGVNAGQADVVSSSEIPSYPADLVQNGVFVNRFNDAACQWGSVINPFTPQTVSLRSINEADGQEMTIMLAENLQSQSWVYDPRGPVSFGPYAEPFVGVVWWANDPASLPANTLWKINGSGLAISGQSNISDAVEYARPSSNHPGGVVVHFCDGHGTFLADSIDYFVYCQIMSSHGAETAPPRNSIGVNQSTFTSNGYLPFQRAVLDLNALGN